MVYVNFDKNVPTGFLHPRYLCYDRNQHYILPTQTHFCKNIFALDGSRERYHQALEFHCFSELKIKQFIFYEGAKHEVRLAFKPIDMILLFRAELI